ncbi:beta-1,3-galactosyltransferase 2-like [Lissotriton helveticus]
MLYWSKRLCSIPIRNWRPRTLLQTFLTVLVFLILLFIWFLTFLNYDQLLGTAMLIKKQAMYVVEEFMPGNETSFLNKLGNLAPPEDAGVGNSSGTHPSRDTGNQMEPHFKYIIKEIDKCQDSHPLLVFLVFSAPGHTEARQAVRETWGNETLVPGIRIVRIFLLGVPHESKSELQQAIMAESRQYHDIVQQEYRDTYMNLTNKTMMGMKWVAAYCPHTSYVMKADCDVFINTEYLVHHLLKPDMPPRQGYFTGYLMRDEKPQRNKNSKWYMSVDLYPDYQYPLFCSGTGYVLSGDLAKKIFDISLSIRQLHLEDVYVGMCLSALGIAPVAPPKRKDFNMMRAPFSICGYRHLVTSHGFMPAELIKYWVLLQENKHHAC